jgi:hypothetical protein
MGTQKDIVVNVKVVLEMSCVANLVMNMLHTPVFGQFFL